MSETVKDSIPDENERSVTFDTTGNEEIPPLPPPRTRSPSKDADALKRSPRPGMQHGQHFDLATGRMVQRGQSVLQLDAGEAKAGSRWDKIKRRLTRAEKVVTTDSGRPVTGKVFRVRSTTRDSFLEGALNTDNASYTFLGEYLRWTFQAAFWEVFLVTYVFFLAMSIFFAAFIYWIGRYQPECISTGGADFIEAGTMFMDAFHLSWTTLSTVGYGVVAPAMPETPDDAQCLGINILMAVEAFVGVLFGGVTGAIIFSKVARVQSIAQVIWSYPICIRYGTGVMQSSAKDAGSEPGDDGEEDEEEDDDDEAKLNLPCPVLEFRLINEMANMKGGEIMDASVNVVATTLAEMDEATSCKDWHSPIRGSTSLVGKATDMTGKVAGVAGKTAMATGKVALTTGKAAVHGAAKVSMTAAKTTRKVAMHTGTALLGAGKAAGQVSGSLLQRLNYSLSRNPRELPDTETVDSVTPTPVLDGLTDKELEQELEKEFAHRFAEKLLREQSKLAGATYLEATQTAVAVDEGNSKLAPRRIFHKLEIETDSHPFFRRVWNIRHRLDESSPLLSLEARNMVAENNGYWPEELNDAAEVRKHLHFREIIVNFSGTANVSGSSVYAQKVYDYVDVNVGYSFASVLRLSDTGKLLVDMALINDVREQKGGGGEVFTDTVVPEETAAAFAARFASEAASGAIDVATKTVDGVKDVASKTADGVKDVASKTSVGVKDVANKTAGGVKDVANRTGEKIHGRRLFGIDEVEESSESQSIEVTEFDAPKGIDS